MTGLLLSVLIVVLLATVVRRLLLPLVLLLAVGWLALHRAGPLPGAWHHPHHREIRA